MNSHLLEKKRTSTSSLYYTFHFPLPLNGHFVNPWSNGGGAGLVDEGVWRWSWVLLRALRRAVNLSSELLSCEDCGGVKRRGRLVGVQHPGQCTCQNTEGPDVNVTSNVLHVCLLFHFCFTSCSLSFTLTVWIYMNLPLFISLSRVHPPSFSPPPPFLSKALGHHPTAAANPCISFPIPIPSGLWCGGDERTFPLHIFDSMAWLLQQSVCPRRRCWCRETAWTLTSPRGRWTFLWPLTLSLSFHVFPHHLRGHTPCLWPWSRCSENCAAFMFLHMCGAALITLSIVIALRWEAVDGRLGDWFLVKCQWRWKYCPKAPRRVWLRVCLFFLQPLSSSYLIPVMI